MFDIKINGKVESWNRGLIWGVARGVLSHALQFDHEVKIFWNGVEISIEAFNQIPVLVCWA